MALWHIFNGDCALKAWQHTGFPGATLVWRENYLHGTLPEQVDDETFCRSRARELRNLAPEIPEKTILADLTAMHRTLAAWTAADTVRLWFDRCPFDQSMLAYLCRQLAAKESLPRVLLTCRDVVWNEAAFKRHYQDSGEMRLPELQWGAERWKAYCRGEADAAGLFDHAPFLR